MRNKTLHLKKVACALSIALGICTSAVYAQVENIDLNGAQDAASSQAHTVHEVSEHTPACVNVYDNSAKQKALEAELSNLAPIAADKQTEAYPSNPNSILEAHVTPPATFDSLHSTKGYCIPSVKNPYIEHAMKVDYNRHSRAYELMEQARAAYYAKDGESAKKYLLEAIDLGNSKAMVMLGHMYCEGYLIEPNIKEGLILIDRAASLGNFTALGFIATEIYKGNVVANHVTYEELLWNVTRGGKSLKRALDVGVESGLYNYEDNDIKSLEETIKRHVASAFRRLGKAYYFGELVETNLPKSANCYQDSLDYEPDEPYVLVHLAHTYYMGIGVPKDDVQAISYATEAAKLGSADGYLALNKFYSDKSSKYYNPKKSRDALLTACSIDPSASNVCIVLNRIM